MKVSCSKTEYLCVNEREASGTVRIQTVEVKRYKSLSIWGQLFRAMGSVVKR